MIDRVLTLLVSELNEFVRSQDGAPSGSPGAARLGNISDRDQGDTTTGLENQIVVSLVNLNEEAALKNARPALEEHGTSGVVYRNQPLHVNLTLLFAANFSDYETALSRLSRVLTFFQGKRKFTLANSPNSSSGFAATDDIGLLVDLLSLSFEEVNYLWGSLGGRQLPSATYRVRLVSLATERVIGGGGRVESIDLRSRSQVAG
jgi:hypothetical protein